MPLIAEHVRDRNGKPGARYERGLAAESPTPCAAWGHAIKPIYFYNEIVIGTFR